MTEPTTRAVIALVPHPDRPALLTTPAGELPTATLEGEWWTNEAIVTVEALLGQLPPVLRLDRRELDRAGEPTLAILDLETVGPDAPAGFVWTDRAAIDMDRLAPDVAAALERWSQRRTAGPFPRDPPWSLPGWSARAGAWMTARMTEAGAPPTAPPRVVYCWGISMVLRAESAAGPWFLKRSTPVFAHEAVVTGAIAAGTPDHVTRVAAVEPNEAWLLMRDHGLETFGDRPPETWSSALVTHAALQRAWSTRTDELVAAGAPVRDLLGLADALASMPDREPLRSELSDADRAAWAAAVPAFAAACRRLDAIGPPATLIHGDLHAWNVAIDPDGAPRIFDWTDAAISHPFLDVAMFATRPDDHAVRRALRDAYLACWTDVLSPADLAEAGDLAILVGTLHQVESYLRLLAGVEPDDQGGMEGATASWARAAIETLDAGIDVLHPGHADG